MLERLTYVVFAGILAVSCNTAKRMAGNAPSSTDNKRVVVPRDNQQVMHTESGSKRVFKNMRRSNGHNTQVQLDNNPYLNLKANIENSSPLQFKYAVLTDVPVEALSNLDLLNFMEEWYGTHYRYGGSDRLGIDCSAFSTKLMSAVFGISVPRTVKEQFDNTRRVPRADLQTGDLLFFDTRGGISHVGVYLLNNKFVHASVSNGVMISDLDEAYFKSRYKGAGRPGL
ncbi:MAG: NlpC/P60 family protein [Chitinophagaceae bacterium]